jgi:hypothetical protein
MVHAVQEAALKAVGSDSTDATMIQLQISRMDLDDLLEAFNAERGKRSHVDVVVHVADEEKAVFGLHLHCDLSSCEEGF